MLFPVVGKFDFQKKWTGALVMPDRVTVLSILDREKANLREGRGRARCHRVVVLPRPLQGTPKPVQGPLVLYILIGSTCLPVCRRFPTTKYHTRSLSFFFKPSCRGSQLLNTLQKCAVTQWLTFLWLKKDTRGQGTISRSATINRILTL